MPAQRITSFVLLILILLFPACPDNESGKADGETRPAVKWESFNSGLAKVFKEKKPAIIDFYADWCHWCKVMDRETFSNNEVAKILARDFITIRVDTQKEESINYMGKNTTSSQFGPMLGVRGLPTIVFMDKEGKLIDLVPGFVKPDIFIGILRYINEECYKRQISFDDYINKKADCDK